MSELRELRGNMFNSRCSTIVNTVNCVGVMGAGIALECKYRFPGLFESYKRACDRSELRPGTLLLWKESTPWVLNFPTKIHWRHPSKLEYIQAGLDKFRSTYRERGIESIAFPQLGASHGTLEWSVVRTLMLCSLGGLENLSVEIYEFDPAAADSLYRALAERTKHYEPEDFAANLGLRLREARIAHAALRSPETRSMMGLQHYAGLGPTTLARLYEFAIAASPTSRGHEVTPRLF